MPRTWDVHMSEIVAQPSHENIYIYIQYQFQEYNLVSFPNNDKQTCKGKTWCDHYRKLGHTKETYWKIHEKLANWKPNRPPLNKVVAQQ